MKKDVKVYLILAIIVIIIIFLIYYIKENNNYDENTIKCIAKNSKVVISKTCSACAAQKQILGNYTSYFELIDISEHPEVWQQYNLKGVPTWIINEKIYLGVRSLKELKKLTRC